MAHLNLYLPNDLASTLKEEAASADLPLSRYVLSLLKAGHVEGKTREVWPPHYFDQACGFLSEEMAEPADALPEPVEIAEPRQ